MPWPSLLEGPDDETQKTTEEDGHCRQLESEPSDDDMSALFRVTLRIELVGGNGCACGLNEQGNDIAGAEDVEIESWRDQRILSPSLDTELCQHDKERSGEEDW